MADNTTWYPVPPYKNEGWKICNEAGELVATFEGKADCRHVCRLHNDFVEATDTNNGVMPNGWREVVNNLINYAWQHTCLHEETYRGGVSWEICSHCGMKWHDSDGGIPDEFGEVPFAIREAESLIAETPKTEKEDES